MSSKELTLRLQRCLKNRERIVGLERKNHEQARQSMTDPLAGLHNCRFFDQVLESEAASNNRSEVLVCEDRTTGNSGKTGNVPAPAPRYAYGY